MAALLDMQENRQAQRWRAMLAGKIVFNNHGSVYDCSIRNLSATGAKIWVFNAATIPDAFELLIEAKALTRPARVVWRSAKEIGVRFADC